MKSNFHLLTVLILTFLTAQLSAQPSSRHQTLREVHYVMGTTLDISLVSSKSLEQAKTVLEKCFLIVQDLDDKLSTYKSESEISRLNLNKKLIGSRETFEVLERSLYFSELTDGIFDITYKSKKPYGFRSVKLTEPDLIESESKIEIDLGAIGKGYAIDQVSIFLNDSQEDNWFINFGTSSITAHGLNSNLKPWHAIIKTEGRDEKVVLKNQSLSTSSNLERHHIVNPVTGKPVKTPRLVSVIAKSATTAEVLSTSLLIEPTLANNLKRILEDISFAIFENGKILESKDW